jgi:hypothetical protein
VPWFCESHTALALWSTGHVAADGALWASGAGEGVLAPAPIVAASARLPLVSKYRRETCRFQKLDFCRR